MQQGPCFFVAPGTHEQCLFVLDSPPTTNPSSGNPMASTPTSEAESPYAWLRLAIALLVGTIGSVGMWSGVVALPAVQADFGARGRIASLHAGDDRLRHRRHRDG
jgi:hypothetical protein